jgi:hypothetical protein
MGCDCVCGLDLSGSGWDPVTEFKKSNIKYSISVKCGVYLLEVYKIE